MNRWRLWLISIAAAVIVSSVSFLAAWVLLTGDQPPPPSLRIGLRCHGPYADRTLMADEFSTVLSTHQAWLESGAKPKDNRRANLCRAKFSEVRNIFYGIDLRGAIFMMANLQGADFREADLQGADFGLANLTGVIYEPNPESLPLLWTLTSLDNHLDEMVFHHTPAALVALREAFKKAGMRTQERQITYAIEHTKRLQAWDPWWYYPAQKDTRPWLEKLWGKLESGFKLVAFELPSDYGMSYGRPLKILAGSIMGFSLVYMIALFTARGRAGIWATWPADRVYQEEGSKEAVRVTNVFLFPRLQAWAAGRWVGVLLRIMCIPLIGLYLSALSAFSLGWRELNVGTWISRMQPREYILRATGWVRFCTGLQSVVSVYLLALWALTYFGRPFE